MKNQTYTKEELILAIATHPQLNDECCKLFNDMQQGSNSMGEALQRALYLVFPAEVNACERIAYQSERGFWDVAADFVQRELFQRSNFVQPTVQPILLPPEEPTSETRSRTNSDSSNDTYLTGPWRRDDYLLMSHTS